ncbi:AMP-binding protein [Sutcliffiella halmapala]|uniref:AMP-binding protein n=1 Tax=Sutcliffiella halmapala TaxID=79882 RepID=UPI000994F5A1|nr:AMP-binding protein [Sutcliffiella halmapala]
MLYINDHYYTKQDFEEQYLHFEQMPLLVGCEKKRIAICTENIFEWLALCFYIRKHRGSVVPIHPATPRDAAIRYAHNTASHLLIFQSLNTPILMINDREEKEGVLVQMSSGTTGAPKCIERPWSSIEEEITSYNASLPVEKEKVPIIACPITHSYGLISGVLSAIERGNEPVIISNLNPKYVLKMTKKHERHILYAAPVFLHLIASFLKREEKLDSVMTSGTMLPALWLELLKEKANVVLQQYGCSEAGCVAIHPAINNANQMGFPLPHLSVEAGNSESEPGEIVIHSRTHTIYTKDLGYFSENGVLCCLGRMDDMINVGGLNVYPQEVEDVLMQEPRISEAVAYKKVDVFAGERVCVQFIADEIVSELELREWCKQRLAPHQIPYELIQVQEIPKLPNGKISRKLVGGVLL